MRPIPSTVVAVVLAGALALSGCAAQSRPAPYATATAADLQQTVMHVTRAAGDGEYAAARTRLEELEVEIKVAHARGELTEARRDSILAAIALVRADLERLVAEAEAKAAAQKAAEKKKAEEEARAAAEAKAAEEARQAAEAQAAAEREATEQAAQQESAGGGGDDDGGNGKGKGNKGKGKGKGK